MIKQIKILVLIAAFICICVISFFYFEHCGDEKQESLLSEIKWIAEQDISSIEIISGKDKSDMTAMRLKISDSQTITLFKKYLKNADKERLGGHNPSVSEQIIIINLKSGLVREYLTSIHSTYAHNKDALYMYFIEGKRNFSDKPIRTPVLGKLLLNLIQKSSSIKST